MLTRRIVVLRLLAVNALALCAVFFEMGYGIPKAVSAESAGSPRAGQSYLMTSDGKPVRAASGCLRSGSWTRDLVSMECDPEIIADTGDTPASRAHVSGRPTDAKLNWRCGDINVAECNPPQADDSATSNAHTTQ